MGNESRTVVVLGASENRDRYSNRAVRLLKNQGFRVVPVHPTLDTVEGLPVLRRLEEIAIPVDTLTLYVGPDHSKALIDSIVALKPGRVVFNPGSESPEVRGRLKQAGIPFLEACTLVMLSTGQF